MNRSPQELAAYLRLQIEQAEVVEDINNEPTAAEMLLQGGDYFYRPPTVMVKVSKKALLNLAEFLDRCDLIR